ncbi:hypothetical protein [Streptomyces roseicoloratus]|uniref:hypothetical protein n=1 Tax=Streptomyces roseicoloratus TaxID=2508722 RepID=UPI001009DA93|nr:hypothetical protein [Streptomyces roseicoloratus]
MGFDEEWSAMRAQAADQQESSMRLNQLPAGPSGPTPPGNPDFGSSPAQKRAAADAIHNELERSTKTATKWADESSDAAVKAFEGWQTAVGLKKVQSTWDDQVRVLLGRLYAEESRLRSASGYFLGNDQHIRGQFAPLGKSRIHDIEPPR